MGKIRDFLNFLDNSPKCKNNNVMSEEYEKNDESEEVVKEELFKMFRDHYESLHKEKQSNLTTTITSIFNRYEQEGLELKFDRGYKYPNQFIDIYVDHTNVAMFDMVFHDYLSSVYYISQKYIRGEFLEQLLEYHWVVFEPNLQFKLFLREYGIDFDCDSTLRQFESIYRVLCIRFKKHQSCLPNNISGIELMELAVLLHLNVKYLKFTDNTGKNMEKLDSIIEKLIYYSHRDAYKCLNILKYPDSIASEIAKMKKIREREEKERLKREKIVEKEQLEQEKREESERLKQQEINRQKLTPKLQNKLTFTK